MSITTGAENARAQSDLGGEPPAAHAAFIPQARVATEAERLAWYSRIVEALAKVSERSATCRDSWEPLRILVDELTRLLGNHATAVYRFEPEGRLLRLICGHLDGRTGDELPGHPFGRADLPVPIDEFPEWPELTASGRPQFLWMPPESTTPPSNEWHVRHRHSYIIQSALMVQGKPLGLLGLAFQSDVATDSAQLEAYAVLAQHLTLILEQAELALTIQRAADLERAQAVIIAREQAARQRSAELEQANAALRVRGGLLSVLAEATRKILEAPDLISGIHGLLRRLGESTQLSRVLFFLERDSASGGKEHYVVTEWCAPGITDHRSVGIEVIPNSVARPFLDRMQGRDAFWLDMQQAEEPMRSALASMKTLSTGCAPVTIDGEYAGVIAFDDCATVRNDEAAHVDAFLAAANVIGAALQRERATERRTEELAKVNNALQAAARGLIRESKLDDVLPTILHAAMDVAGASGGAVLRRPDATTEFVYEVIIHDGVLLAGPALEEHLSTLPVREESRTDPEHYFVRLAAGETVWRLAEDEQAEPLDQRRRWHKPRGQKAVWDIPFSVGNRVTGYLTLAFTHADSPSESVKETVNALATQAGLAMQLTALAQSDKQAAVLREQQQSAIQRAAELERSGEALQRTIDAVSELQTLNDFVPRALRIVAEAFGACSAAYWEHPGAKIYLRFWLLDGEIFSPKDLPGLARDRYAVMTQLAEGFSVPREHLDADLHDRMRPSIVHHATATASPALHQFALGMGWEWELNVPLIISGRATGALTLYRSNGRPFTDAEFALAEGLAKQMALAMKISGLAERERGAATARAVALERLRIAAEMHDSLAQSFTSIAMQSESLRSLTPEPSAAADTLQVIELTARQGLAEVRASVLTLHSLDGPPGTLDKALGQLAARCNVPGSIRCDFLSTGEPCEVAGDTRESLMRIAREALNNAMRHSGGTRMLLTLAYAGGRVHMSVEDDGTGLTDDARHGRPGYGLEGMARRAEMIGGTLQCVRSELGGAMVAVDLPCMSSQSARKDPWA